MKLATTFLYDYYAKSYVEIQYSLAHLTKMQNHVQKGHWWTTTVFNNLPGLMKFSNERYSRVKVFLKHRIIIW